MRVYNPSKEHGVFVREYGVVPPDEEATVRESDAVKQMIKDGVLRERKSGSGSSSSSTTEQKEGDG